MSDVAASTTLIDLDKIDIPADSRPHDPDKLAALAESMRDGQEQEIGVVRAGDRFELIFGKGRVLSMRALKAVQIRARVYENLTEAQKLDLTFTENEEREDVNPIYQAYLLEKMVAASGLSQNQFVKSRGKAKGWISNYKSYLKLPDPVLEVFKGLNTSGANLQALRRLKSPELQIQVAQEVKEGKTKPEDVGKRCKELMGKSPLHPPSIRPYVDGRTASLPLETGREVQKGGWGDLKPGEASLPTPTPPPNAFADFLKSLIIKDTIAPIGAWDTAFGLSPKGSTDELSPWGWTIWIRANTPTPKTTVKRILLALANAIGDTRAEEDAQARKVQELTNPQEPAVRLPKTDEEWNEVGLEAARGPGYIYGWTHGKSSRTFQERKDLTWEDLGEIDIDVGCEKIIEALRQGQTSKPVASAGLKPTQAQPLPAPGPVMQIVNHPTLGKVIIPARPSISESMPTGQAGAVPAQPKQVPGTSKWDSLLEGLDPETRALVEAEIEKGPLI